MTRAVVIRIVILVSILGLGVAGFLLFRSFTTEDLVTEQNPIGVDSTDYDKAYQVTTAIDGQVLSVIDIDPNDNMQITASGEEQGTTLIIDGFSYTQDGSQWLRSVELDVSLYDLDFMYNQQFLSQLFSDGVTELDEMACGSATCRVYESSRPEAASTTVVKINASTNRIVEVTIRGTSTITTTYVYDTGFTLSPPDTFVDVDSEL